MGRPTRRRVRPERFVAMAGALLVAAGLAKVGWLGSEDGEGVRRQLAGGGAVNPEGFSCETAFPAFCSDAKACATPSDYALVCCNATFDDKGLLDENALCITASGPTCPLSQLCTAEIVPGGTGAGECLQDWEVSYGGWVYIFVLLYLFLGLAIICDDYFVGALEKISGGLGLSEDVAGATFMAAGSSAPELFVSLADNVISNPPKSVGIGTIVGSAIFNILVIIGLSAALAGQTLALDWRPLSRDVSFYIVSVVALLIVVLDGEVRWYEALILLLLYALYIAFMSQNARFFAWLDRKLGLERPDKAEDVQQADAAASDPARHSDGNITTEPTGDAGSGYGPADPRSFQVLEEVELAIEDKPHGAPAGGENAGAGLDVAPVAGTGNSDHPVVRAAEAVLRSPHASGVKLGKPAVRHTVETSRPTAAVEAAAAALRLERHDSDPHIRGGGSHGDLSRVESSRSAFRSGNPMHMSRNRAAWRSLRHGSGSQRFHSDLKSIASAVVRADDAAKDWQAAVDADAASTKGATHGALRAKGFGTNDSSSTSASGPDLEHAGADVVADATSAVHGAAANPVLASVGAAAVAEEEDDPGYYWEPLVWPVEDQGDPEVEPSNGSAVVARKSSYLARCCCGWRSTWSSRIWYIISFPYNVAFRLTVPDCGFDVFCEDREDRPENRRIAYWLSFFMSIVWIAVLSHFLVWAGAKFGCIVGIPPPVMGLTILAAGTSVPDALSSVIVAKQGQGDMAVANSIGSNVFDILLGLGLPWFLATAFVYKEPSLVLTDSLWVGIGFLFGVVVCLIVVLVIFNWRMGKRVGAVLISLYVLYIIFELFIHCRIKDTC